MRFVFEPHPHAKRMRRVWLCCAEAGHNCCRGQQWSPASKSLQRKLPRRPIYHDDLPDESESESDITFEVLKKWNLHGIVRLVQAVLMLLASQLVPRIRDFLELTTAFQDYDDGKETRDERQGYWERSHRAPGLGIFVYVCCSTFTGRVARVLRDLL